MTIFPQAEPGSDPLQCVTNLDVNIPPEKVADMTGFLVDILNPSIMELRRLFLLESIFDTIKFILCLWGLTYIGSWYEITYFPISSAIQFCLSQVQHDDPCHPDLGGFLHPAPRV